MLLWFVILIFLTRSLKSENSLCGKVSTFDAVCKQNDILYILSASPCHSTTSVSLTIIDLQNATQYYHVQLEADTHHPISLPGKSGKGIILTQHLKPGSDNIAKDYHKTRLHVLLHMVDIELFDQGTAHFKDEILNVYFPMFTSDCIPEELKLPHVANEMCQYGHVLGNYSSLCVIPKTSNSSFDRDSINPGVFLLVVDVCTTPYSVSVISILFSGLIMKRRFTQDKTDSYVSLPGGNPNCGFGLKFQDVHSVYLHATLYHGCVGGKNVTILNSVFHSHGGIICPMSECESYGLRHVCSVPWIFGEKEDRLAVIELSLNICKPEYNIWWYYYMNDTKKLFPFSKHEILHHSERKPFHIGYPKRMHDPISTNNGYLYLDWGEVSLYTRRKSDLVFVTVIRHYPLETDGFPLFRTEFWLEEILKNKDKLCKFEDKSLKTGLPIAGAALVVFFIVVIFLCRKYMRRFQRGGLPYEIHLGEMEDEMPQSSSDLRV